MGKTTIGKWEATKTVGEILKSTREEKNLSPEDISEKTNIRVHFIQMIEQDNFDKLPSKIHINGFISVYSRCLGIDPNDILLHLQKQEMLNRDTPIEELLSISKDSSLKDKKKIIIYSLSGIVGLVLIIFLFKFFFGSSQSSNYSKSLTDENPSITLPVKVGDEISFKIDNKSFRYTVLDFNEQTTVLRYEGTNERFYILNNEVLKHDHNDNYEYNYQIKKEKIVNQTMYLSIAKIKDLRTEQQAVFSTFLDNSIQNIAKEKLVMINTLNRNIFINVVYTDGKEEEKIVASRATFSIPLMKDSQQYLKTVYFSDLSGLSINIHGVNIDQEFIKKGMIGYLSISFANPSDINTMTYNIYY